MINARITDSPGQRVTSGITPISELKLCESSGVLQNLIVTETTGADTFAILVEGTGATEPVTNDGFVFAFPLAANGVAHLKAPIAFTGGLWMVLRATIDVADGAGSGIALANIAG